MRSRRLSFLAGWLAVALLAALGFAAFGTSDGPADQPSVDAAAATMGHTAGAFAGMSFALLAAPADDITVSDYSPPESLGAAQSDNADAADAKSINLRTGAQGIFQHLPRYWDERSTAAGFEGAEQTNPEASIAAAAWAVYNGGGWDVFACRG